MPNKTGFQFQVIGEAQRTMLRATWPYCLKMLQGGKSLELAREWRGHRPDGVLVLRYVTADNEPLSQLPLLTDRAVQEFAGFQSVGGRVVLEVPVNERFHTDPADFAALAEASVVAAATIKKAGFTPGVLITSEGNPPGPRFGVDYFLQPRVLECMLSFRAMGAVWCPHGYSHPPAASDEAFHATRPSWIMGQLPEPARLNYLYGESGCDGGTDQPNRKPGRGWTDYFDSPRAYADWYRTKSRAIAQDSLCVGAAIFLCGADPGSRPPWDSFDIGDEVDLRPVFTEDVPGPPITWLSPSAPEVTVPDISLSVPTSTALANPANYSHGPRAKTMGVVIHTTRGGAASLAAEYAGTVAWFQNPAAQVSAHLVVGPASVARCVHDADVAWHARSANATHLGIEICQPTIATPITGFQYRAAAEACRLWAAAHGFPLQRVWTITQPGLVGHEDSEPGKIDGKTDPGPQFDWPKFLALCKGGTMPDDPNALRDQTYALGEQLQKLGPTWRAAGYPQTAEYVENQGNAIKKTMVIQKGEH